MKKIRTCSVSTNEETCPLSSTPRIRNLAPALSQLNREMSACIRMIQNSAWNTCFCLQMCYVDRLDSDCTSNNRKQPRMARDTASPKSLVGKIENIFFPTSQRYRVQKNRKSGPSSLQLECRCVSKERTWSWNLLVRSNASPGIRIHQIAILIPRGRGSTQKWKLPEANVFRYSNVDLLLPSSTRIWLKQVLDTTGWKLE